MSWSWSWSRCRRPRVVVVVLSLSCRCRCRVVVVSSWSWSWSLLSDCHFCRSCRCRHRAAILVAAAVGVAVALVIITSAGWPSGRRSSPPPPPPLSSRCRRIVHNATELVIHTCRNQHRNHTRNNLQVEQIAAPHQGSQVATQVPLLSLPLWAWPSRCRSRRCCRGRGAIALIIVQVWPSRRRSSLPLPLWVRPSHRRRSVT